MRYVILLAAGFSISLLACNAPTTSTKKTDRLNQGQGQSATVIGEEQIFDKKFILSAVTLTEGKNKTSDKYFLKGVDAYRNQKNPEEGVKLFKQSIMAQPQARAYFELGNALADLNNLKDATRLIRLRMHWTTSPLRKCCIIWPAYTPGLKTETLRSIILYRPLSSGTAM